MKYGKLIDGDLYIAPNILIKDNKQHINPPKELYLELGYFPLEFTPKPICNNDLLAISICRWEQLDDRILQVWVF